MIIPSIDPWIADWVAAGRGTTHALQTPASKVIISDEACIGTRVFWTPGDVIRKDRDGMTPRDSNTFIRPPMLNFPVLIGGGTTASLTRSGS